MIKKTLILTSLGVAFVLGGATDSSAAIYYDKSENTSNTSIDASKNTVTDNSGQTLNGGVNTAVVPVVKTTADA